MAITRSTRLGFHGMPERVPMPHHNGRVGPQPALFPEPWTIHANVQITRRKTFFLVTNPQGETVYRNRWLWPCIDWLDTMEVRAYIIRPGNEEWPQHFPVSINREKDGKWQK